LIALGNDRSKKDIEKRVMELKLNLEGYHGGSDDIDMNDDDNDDSDDNNNDKNITFSDSDNDGNNIKSNVSSASKTSATRANAIIDNILDIPAEDDVNSFEKRLRENWEQGSDDDESPRKRSNNDKMSKKKKLQKKLSNKIISNDDDDDISDIGETETTENKENVPSKKRQLVIDSDDDL